MSTDTHPRPRSTLEPTEEGDQRAASVAKLGELGASPPEVVPVHPGARPEHGGAQRARLRRRLAAQPSLALADGDVRASSRAGARRRCTYRKDELDRSIPLFVIFFFSEPFSGLIQQAAQQWQPFASQLGPPGRWRQRAQRSTAVAHLRPVRIFFSAKPFSFSLLDRISNAHNF